MVLLTLIARVKDGLIFATSIEGADDPDHNMVRHTTQAKAIFRKLSAPGTPQVQSITSGQYYYHYLIKGPICALCLCEQTFPRKLAFSFLEDIATEFLNQNATKVDAVMRPFHFLEFDAYIQQAKRTYTDTKMFTMTAVNNELKDVTRIMVSNIDDVIHRGEALNILESRASDLSSMSRKYREDARQLNRKGFLFKMVICFAFAAILFLIIRFFYF